MAKGKKKKTVAPVEKETAQTVRTKLPEKGTKPEFKVREVSPDELEQMQNDREDTVDEKEEPRNDAVDMSRQDFCNGCGTPSVGGALQVRVPIQSSDGRQIIINLPLLACVRCGNAYMPKTFIQQVLEPQKQPEEEKVIVTPEKGIVIP